MTRMATLTIKDCNGTPTGHTLTVVTETGTVWCITWEKGVGYAVTHMPTTGWLAGNRGAW